MKLLPLDALIWCVLRWRPRIPFELRILPVIRKLDAFKHSPRAPLGVEEAKSAGPLPSPPNPLHSRLEPPFVHFPLALRHRHVVAVKRDMLHAFLSAPLLRHMVSDLWWCVVRRISFSEEYLVQVLRHQALPSCRLHDFKGQVAVLGKADFELEGAGLPAETALGDRGWGEVEDLEGTDAKLEEAVHGLLVVTAHNANFGNRTQEGTTQGFHS